MLSKKKPQDKVDPEYLVGLATASAQPAPAGVKNGWKSRRRPFHPGRASSAFILRFTASGQRRKSSKLRLAPFIFLFFTHAANMQKERHCTNCAVSFFLVENTGIEPVTSCMPCKRSPEPRTHAPPHKGARMNNIRCKNVKIEEITSVSPLERLLWQQCLI